MAFRSAIPLTSLWGGPLWSAVFSAITLCSSAPVFAQEAPNVSFFARNLTRAEAWRFFEPPPPADGAYAFVGNRLSFGLDVEGERWAAGGTFQYVQLIGLPRTAQSNGPLGSGGEYFAAAGTRQAAQLYARRMYLRLKSAGQGTTLTVGRFDLVSGAEADSRVTSLEFLKRERLDGRVLSSFDWSLYQRAFDGARLDIDRSRWHATAAFALPSQGGYEESATPTITNVQVASATLTARPYVLLPWSELQLFTHVYRDRRLIADRPDSLGIVPGTGVEVTVANIGGSQTGIFPTVYGEADSVVWAAAQVGRWYGQPHRAYSVAAEIGHRWTAVRWQPWLRAGFSIAAGDEDGLDARHGTWFAMLPDVQRYGQTAVYTQMNLRDLFVQAYLYPTPRLTFRTDVHRLDLANAADGWYSGAGAQNRRGRAFGFVQRPSGGSRSLGTTIEQRVIVRAARRWSLEAFAGFFLGGAVVRHSFRSDRLLFGSLESGLRF